VRSERSHPPVYARRISPEPATRSIEVSIGDALQRVVRLPPLRRLIARVDRPSQWRRTIFFVLKVDVGTFDQPCRQPNLAKESGPVERGLREKPAQFRLGSPIQQPETNLFGPKTRWAYQGRVALLAVFAVPLKIKISTGLNKGINQRSCQCALE
jgi:hypothetical protein